MQEPHGIEREQCTRNTSGRYRKKAHIWLLTSSQHQFVDSFRRRFVRVHGEFVAIRRAGGGVMGAVTGIYTEMVNAVK